MGHEDEYKKNQDQKQTDTGSNAYKYIITFLGGLAAGVALGMYLNSKQGKKIRKQVKHRMSDLEMEIEDKVNYAMDEIQNLASKANVFKEKQQDGAEQ